MFSKKELPLLISQKGNKTYIPSIMYAHKGKKI